MKNLGIQATNKSLLSFFASKKKNHFGMTPMGAIDQAAEELNTRFLNLDELVLSVDHDVDAVFIEASMLRNSTFKEKMTAIEKELPYLNTWDLTDEIIRFIKKPVPQEEITKYSKKFLKNRNPFVRRLGYTLWLKSDLTQEKTLQMIFPLFKSQEEYTVLMAEAWLISYMFIYSFSATYEFIRNSSLDYKLISLGLTKTTDSFRISEEDKIKIRALRDFKRDLKSKKE